MPRTPEQIAATDALAAAVEQCIRANDPETLDEGMIGDFIVVVSHVKLIEERAEGAYFLLFSGGNMLPHVASGLLAQGEDLVLNGMNVSEEE